MIYIFQGCGNICMLPCTLCKCCGDLCDKFCKGCSDACRDCCQAWSDTFAPIMQNPLAFYVIGTWIAMILVIVACVATVITVPDCNDLKIFCFADIGIAVIHAAFAFYIQRQLVNGIFKMTGKDSAKEMDHDDITKAAKDVLKYDIGFCLYFFFFIAAFCYNCYGVNSATVCKESGYLMAAVGLMIVYGVGAFNYGFCWYCGQCCFGKAKKAKGIVKKKGGPGSAPQAETMGSGTAA
mmetsp:Transcript_100054/g.278735  ORF Transcript_100054/g.278735 Transcript_100054/m.278735 type:complete len:237 (-) Transcript_100054:425-1135(-)